MSNLSKKEKDILTLAQKISKSSEDGLLFILDKMHEMEDRMEEMHKETTDPLIERIETLRDDLVSFKMPNLNTLLESIRGRDGENGRNPLTTSKTPPPNPQIGDLWYQP